MYLLGTLNQFRPFFMTSLTRLTENKDFSRTKEKDRKRKNFKVCVGIDQKFFTIFQNEMLKFEFDRKNMQKSEIGRFIDRSF